MALKQSFPTRQVGTEDARALPPPRLPRPAQDGQTLWKVFSVKILGSL